MSLEFYQFGSGLIGLAGVHAPADIDVFTAITTGLAHQQVANDPGGNRWVRLAGMEQTLDRLAQIVDTKSLSLNT